VDPVTIIAVATTAYNAIKRGIEIGRELQDMGGQLSQWAGAISDLEFLSKKAEDPPWWKMGGSVQAEAVEIFAAKKKIEAQRAELRVFIQYSYGQSAWEELLKIEAQVRKQRAATAHRQAEMKENLISIAIILLGITSIGGLVGLLIWFIMENKQ
jgi:hypothetical protein